VLRADGELLPAGGEHIGSAGMSVAATSPSLRRPQPPAHEPMWAELHAHLRAFVARRVRDQAAADDLAQEIMLRLYTQMGRLRRQDRLDAWAYQVARNVIADYWRDRAASRELPIGDRLDEQLASVPELEDDDDAERLRAEIASCLAPMVERLPEPYREAIRVTDLGGRTQTDAAAALGLSVPGMKARVQRGRTKLRELLRACCRVELDRRGQITTLERRKPQAGCGCRPSPGTRP
jgi:RNA polymerase sigma-70 factor, ECF subfamily